MLVHVSDCVKALGVCAVDPGVDSFSAGLFPAGNFFLFEDFENNSLRSILSLEWLAERTVTQEIGRDFYPAKYSVELWVGS